MLSFFLLSFYAYVNLLYNSINEINEKKYVSGRSVK